MMVDLYFYRDPEAEENKDAAMDEAKVPGADEVGPAAIEQGFGGNQDWEIGAGNAGGAFSTNANTGGAAANSSWEQDGADWAAGGATQTGNEGWNAEKPAETTW